MKKNWLILVFILVCGIVFADDADFRNIKWGMTQNEVIQSEELKSPSKKKDLISYTINNMYEWKARLTYYFNRDGILDSANYNFFNTAHVSFDANVMDQMGVALYQTLQADLIKKYGPPKEDNVIWANESFKSLPTNMGAHVVAGRVTFSTVWETEKTVINLSCARGVYMMHPFANSIVNYYEKSYYQSLIQQAQQPSSESKNL